MTTNNIAKLFSTSSSSTPDLRNVLGERFGQYSIAVAKKVAAMKKPDETFKQLDMAVRSTTFTTQSIAAAKPDDLKTQILQIVKWKLARGQFRPTLYAQATSNSAETFKTALQNAAQIFDQHIGDALSLSRDAQLADPISFANPTNEHKETFLRTLLDAQLAALEALTKPLKGIGPATATAILSQLAISVSLSNVVEGKKVKQLVQVTGLCPFMADEALSIVIGRLDYTPAAAKKFFGEMNELWFSLYVSHGDFFLHLISEAAKFSNARRVREKEKQKQFSTNEIGNVLTLAQLSHTLWVQHIMTK
jgi:DNA uptake protein ComE-like DNA-binding protein